MNEMVSGYITFNGSNFTGRNETSTADTLSRPYHDKVDYEPNIPLQVVFGFVAFFAFSGNFLLCVVICRRRCLLQKMYNVLILNLAITDMSTG